MFLAVGLEKQRLRGVMSPAGGRNAWARPEDLIGQRWPGVVKVLEAGAVGAMVMVVVVAR